MTTPSTTASPTLAADWAPTSAGCLRTDDYWIWDFNAENRDARTVIGGPSQTTNCFASTWNPTITYVGSGCPPQYTSACQNGDFDVVTCCPSAYDFTCQPETWTPGVHAEWFRCVSKYGSQDAAKVTLTDFRQNTIAVGTRTRHTYEHLVALALMYTKPPSTSPSPTTSLPTSTSSPTSTGTPSTGETSSGLSPGAAAGIGVGVAAAVFLLALLAWLLYRRKKTSRPSNDASQPPTSVSPSAPPWIPSSIPSSSPPTAYTAEDSRGASPYSVEPKVSLPPRELPAGEETRFELDDNSVPQQNRWQ